jgi:murein DD-endopeptidase MepM/ murein hydrolase activator NlpD
MKRAAAIAVLFAAAVAWMSRDDLVRAVPLPWLPMAAHDQYTSALRFTGALNTDEGRAWTRAARVALEQPIDASAWFSAAGAFARQPAAVLSWRFPARRGQRVTIDPGAARDTVFLDLFTADGRKRTASLRPRAATLSYVVEEDGELIARLQPRLDGEASYAVVQHVAASLRFPVQGRTGAAVRSAFGATRDAGARRHEGIDIFAPRGTPVVAAADGWIAKQTTNRLGGNVVWLWLPSRRLSLYYAHLERQAVGPGARVRTGDVLGFVGNTGNARFTAPHLHFGVYAGGEGAVDPYPFVVDPVMQRQHGTAGRHR